MATRGRKPKPTAMKELEGNPGKHPLNTSEPKPNKKAPACPKWLEPEAKKEWRRLAKQMEAIGILTEVDMAAFAGYCQAYARWKEAEEFITQHSNVSDIKNLVGDELVASAIKSAMAELGPNEVTNRTKIEPLAQQKLAESLVQKYGDDVVFVNKVVINDMNFEDRR